MEIRDEMQEQKSLDKRCKDAAAALLARKGYSIIDRDWGCFAGVIDIVAKDPYGTVVFADVRYNTETDEYLEDPNNAEKRERLEKMALAWLQDNDLSDVNFACRFDVVSLVAVNPDRALIRHHINAYQKDPIPMALFENALTDDVMKKVETSFSINLRHMLRGEMGSSTMDMVETCLHNALLEVQAEVNSDLED